VFAGLAMRRRRSGLRACGFRQRSWGALAVKTVRGPKVRLDPPPGHGVGFGGRQRVDELGQQVAWQIRAGLGQLFLEQMCRSILGATVIVVSFFESVVRDHSKNHAVAVTACTRAYVSSTWRHFGNTAADSGR
jgi:hypothetical protein